MIAAVIEAARSDALARYKGLNKLSLESRVGRAICLAIQRQDTA